MSINVIQFGMGFYGKGLVGLMLRKRGYNLVGAVDIEPEYVGKDIGELLGIGRDIGVKVTNDAQRLFKEVKADIVSLATMTKADVVCEHVILCIEAGLNVATTSEELAYPWVIYPEISEEIDKKAKEHNVSVIASGVNPGYIMDWIPLALASGCCNIDKIRVQRVVDYVNPASRRLQRFGVKPQELREIVLGNKILHPGQAILHSGLPQSMGIIADALSWKLDNCLETWEPIVSRSRRESWCIVEPGTTAGFKQTIIGSLKGEAKIILEVSMLIKPNIEDDGMEPGDTIWIDGEPSIIVKMIGPSAHHDLVTYARIVNILPAVVEAKPGLISVNDLPVKPPPLDK